MTKSQFSNNFIDGEAINKQSGEPFIFAFGPSTLRDDQGRVTYKGPIFIANFNGLGITTAEKLKRLIEKDEVDQVARKQSWEEGAGEGVTIGRQVIRTGRHNAVEYGRDCMRTRKKANQEKRGERR